MIIKYVIGMKGIWEELFNNYSYIVFTLYCIIFLPYPLFTLLEVLKVRFYEYLILI